jgi:hypothetical protein
MGTPPVILKAYGGDLQMKQIIGRCLRKKWTKSPKIYIVNDMFSFFYGHYKSRLKYFKSMGSKYILKLNETKKLYNPIGLDTYDPNIEDDVDKFLDSHKILK